jgi:hypothetical protein
MTLRSDRMEGLESLANKTHRSAGSERARLQSRRSSPHAVLGSATSNHPEWVID